MGQQQLLLLVIGVVLVGLAIVAAYPFLQRGFRQDEADGLLDRSLTIASHAVSWKSRMDPYNGGDQSYAGLATDGLNTLALDEANVRGRYAITVATADSLVVTGVSDRYPDIGVRVYVVDYDVTSSDVTFDGSVTIP